MQTAFPETAGVHRAGCAGRFGGNGKSLVMNRGKVNPIKGLVSATGRAWGRRLPGMPAIPWAFLAVLSALSVLHPFGLRAAQDPCADGLTGRIQSNYQAMRSFRGRFEQENRRTDGRVVKARGKIAYLKPGRMRWEYEPPNEQLLVTDGKTMWLHDPILDNVTVQPLADLTQGTPLAFLLGAGNLNADFRCRPFTQPPPKDGLAYVELVPRKPIPTLAYIQLGADPDTAQIAALRMVDKQGNSRWVRFSQLRIDLPLSASQFTFEVTPEMEVITKSGSR